MKLKSLLAAVLISSIASLSFAQSAPAAAAESPSQVETVVKKPAKKHGHKVSAKKHKAAKHKKKAAM
jgi:hypothetical protein